MKKINWLIALIALSAAFVVGFSACSNPAKDGSDTKKTGGKHSITNLKEKKDSSVNHGYLTVVPSAFKNDEVTVYATPEKGYDVNLITYNDNVIVPQAKVYKFIMPDEDVTIDALFKQSANKTGEGGEVFDNGLSNGVAIGVQTDWLDGENSLSGKAEVAPGKGMDDGTSAIEINFTKITNILAVSIPFAGVNMDDVHALSFWAKTTYHETGKPGSPTPAFLQVGFGKRGPKFDGADHIWADIEKAVKYTGPQNTGIKITEEWQNFVIPVIGKPGVKADVVQFLFTPRQIEGVPVFIDQILFIKNDIGAAELRQIELPTTGIIPSKSSTDVALSTDLQILTMNTKLGYEFDNSWYNFYGKTNSDETAAYLNKFEDFYPGKIVYSSSSPTAPVSGKMISPTGVGTTDLTVAYDGVSSTNSVDDKGKNKPSKMVITILDAPQAPVSGAAVLLDATDTIPTLADGKLDYTKGWYWGGTAGDAQWRDDLIHFYMANILEDRILDDGTPADNWYVMGTTTLNHNISSLSSGSVTIKLMLNGGIVYRFSLSSGYSGVASTLNTKYDPNGVKKESYIEITGKGSPLQEYTYPMADFRASKTKNEQGEEVDNDPVDLTCVTGFQFSTDRSFNTTPAAEASWKVEGGPNVDLESIVVR